MTWKTTVLATIAAGAMAGGVYSALPAGAASRPALAKPAACEGREQWPDVVNGRPAALDRHDQGGVYLWHAEDGWRLVVTHGGNQRVEFSGSITTNGTIGARRVFDERDDHVSVGPFDHVASFRFANYGGFDGMTFQTHCADRLVVRLQINGHEVTPELVFIGHDKTNPTSVPFTLERDGLH
jgi:hypothetical protein